jgi:hypothetical protein
MSGLCFRGKEGAPIQNMTIEQTNLIDIISTDERAGEGSLPLAIIWTGPELPCTCICSRRS